MPKKVAGIGVLGGCGSPLAKTMLAGPAFKAPEPAQMHTTASTAKIGEIIRFIVISLLGIRLLLKTRPMILEKVRAESNYHYKPEDVLRNDVILRLWYEPVNERKVAQIVNLKRCKITAADPGFLLTLVN
jgi:hypothetical protein